MAKVNFLKSAGAWFKNRIPTRRRIIQIYAALLYNSNIKGFFSGNIHTGKSKNLCVPGLNCYSCPGAVGACPLGALQDSLAQSNTRMPFYILGILALVGLMLGRTVCGFLCPVGLGQELLHKIKTPKLKKSKYTRYASYFKYILLALCVVAIPLIYHGVPAFCKYICPAGTFGGALPLLLNAANADFFEQLKYLFTWKFALMVIIITLCVFIYRFFCRFICPLGAIYGFFNKIALLGVKLDDKKCVDCGLCLQTCQMDIKKVGDHECINCGACIPVCPTQAISWKGSKLFVANSVIDAPQSQEKVALASLASGGAVTSAPVTLSETAEESAAPVVQQEPAAEQQEFKKAHKKLKSRTFWLELSAWVMAAALLITSLVYFNFFAKEEKVEKQTVCPEFTITLFNDGGEFDLDAELASGKIVILNFWYLDCTGCKLELPEFNQFARDYADSVTVLILHNNDFINYSDDEITTFLATENDGNGLPYIEYTPLFGRDTEELNLFKTLGGGNVYPMTVILDSGRNVRFRHVNSTTYETLKNDVEELLSE